MIRFSQLRNSFLYALHGLSFVYKHEQNFRIQAWVSVVVVLTGFYVGLSNKEWVIILLVISMVLLLELVNTLVEKVIDILKPKIHHYVKLIKDIMAAAVFLVSITAVLIGVIIFYPYVRALLFL